MIDLYDYFEGHPNIIISGFKNVGIVDSLARLTPQPLLKLHAVFSYYIMILSQQLV